MSTQEQNTPRREIKFRAWRDGEMLYQQQEGTAYVAALFNRIYSQHPVMQYTGLKDKNGKEIYEGDVVESGGYKMEVRWNERFACFCLMHHKWMYPHFFGEAADPDECEVINNIYETPKLSESKHP